MVTFDEWKASLAKFLVSQKRGVTVARLDPAFLEDMFKAGTAPFKVASMANLPVSNHMPQHPSVLADPKYLLNTGTGYTCPVCGSTFIKVLEKEGSGMGYIGDVGWVIGASIFESMVKAGQKHPLMCGYCDSIFSS